jgi:hypothetical protein
MLGISRPCTASLLQRRQLPQLQEPREHVLVVVGYTFGHPGQLQSSWIQADSNAV